MKQMDGMALEQQLRLSNSSTVAKGQLGRYRKAAAQATVVGRPAYHSFAARAKLKTRLERAGRGFGAQFRAVVVDFV